MEIHPENEPFLDKEDKNNEYYLNIKKKEKDEQQKSEKQILTDKDYSELFFCCCIDYNITKKQYNHYTNLLEKCSTLYNENNPEHEKLLEDFFNNVNEILPNEDEELYENIDNNNINNNILDKEKVLIKKLSKRVGFQSENPTTDFRAGGLYSLEFMNYFVTNYKIQSMNLLKEKQFPFALVCINISFLLYLILYLGKDRDQIDKTLESKKLKGCNRKQIKHFCEHLENDNDNSLLFLIISQCLCFVYAKYFKDLHINSNDDNILDKIIYNGVEYFKELLSDVHKNENLVDKLRIKLERAKNQKIKDLPNQSPKIKDL